MPRWNYSIGASSFWVLVRKKPAHLPQGLQHRIKDTYAADYAFSGVTYYQYNIFFLSYWSKENLEYMQKTAELETKYGTKKYDKLLEKMSDREYEQFKTLEEASPMWKTSTLKKASTSKKAVEKAENSGTITVKSNVVKSAIDSGAVSKDINANKQSRHIKGGAGYIEGRSYINGTLEDAQKLVNELSGTGSPILDANGKWTNKERVQKDSVIGVHVDQETKKETETSKATIIYSKTGSHIVPRKEDDK